MRFGLTFTRTASALALVIGLGFAATASAQSTPPAETQDIPAQEAPTLQPMEEALPPPLVPAPDLPTDDPVVELPPEGESQPPALEASPLVPGLPITPDGRVFSFADLAEQLSDSVVYISTSQRVTISQRRPFPNMPGAPEGDDFFEDFFDDGPGENRPDPRTVESLGSGFVIDESGLIVTNNHVIADADEIVANFANGSNLVAEVLGTDEKTDLALLKVTPSTPLKVAKFGRSEQLRVGDWVLAIGNPFGFGGTVTAGIVSALDRDINSGPYDHYIQTDASINRGNSGGPLFNINGEVVGINTAIMSPTGGSIGIGFAVPSEIAVPVIEQLREFGEVRRGWIGVRIQEVTDDFAESLGMESALGALIAGVTENGPAANAGIQAGDVVVEFDGVTVENMRALPRIVADRPPGETVEVVVQRDGERLTLPIEVGLLDDEPIVAVNAEGEDGEDQPAEAAPENLFGLTLGPITDDARQTYDIGADVEGVLVAEVGQGSEAEQKGMEPGDVIVQVSQQEVRDAEAVTERIEELRSLGRRSVMLLVSGVNKELRFVSLRFDAQ